MNTHRFSRRQFLHTLKGIGLSIGATSCDTPLPYRGQSQIQRKIKDEIIVDSHCHIFNGRDVDVRAYGRALAREKAGGFGDSLLGGFVGDFVEGVAAAAPGITAENDELEVMIRSVKGKKWSSEDRIRFLTRKLVEVSSRKSFDSKGPDINRHHKCPLRKFWQVPGMMWGHDRSLHSQLKHHLKKTFSSKDAETLAALLADCQSAKLIAHITNYRWVNAYELWRQFTVNRRNGSPNGNVDLFVVATLDMNSWLNASRKVGSGTFKSTKCYMEHQADLMENISIIFGGELLGMAGFCPRFAAEVNNGFFQTPERQRSGTTYRFADPVKILEKAVMCQGHLGAKLYPPMGFQAYGNSDLDSSKFGFAGLKNWDHANIPTPLGAAMDEQLARLYQWCDENDVAIMAHTGPTHGAERDYGLRADPTHWEEVLGSDNGGLGRHNLRVNLSHLGCWAPEASKKEGKSIPALWADKIIHLTAQYPHVYSDIADMAGLGNRKEWGIAFDRALHLWSEIPHSSPTNRMFRKLMYGSDWFVLAHDDLSIDDENAIAEHSEDWSKLRVGRSYAQRWASFAQEEEDKHGWHASDLMGHNAIRFLGLDKEKTRDRIDAFFCKHDLYWPSWRKKLHRLVKAGAL